MGGLADKVGCRGTTSVECPDCEEGPGISLAALVIENFWVVGFGASMLPARLPYRSGVCASASNARVVSNFKGSCPSCKISEFPPRRPSLCV